MTTAITVPEGIDDVSTRAIVALINERLDSLPIERVLVWHLASQSAPSLYMAAELLGLTAAEFGGEQPTAPLLKKGVELRRTKGTPGTLLEVLDVLGFDEPELDEEAWKYFDGSVLANGEWRAGADRSERFFQVYVEVSAPLTTAEQRALWDLVYRWSRRSCAFALGLRKAGEPTTMIRTRPA